MKRIDSKYIETGNQWLEDHALLFDSLGKIVSICPQAEAEMPDDYSNLGDKLIIPGCINSHSHAFQGFLRPTTGQPQNFQDWVDRFLYPLVLKLDEKSLYASALLVFSEMLKGGITTVGEFFYLNNQPDFASSQGRNAEIVIQAALDLGMRISLIRSLYDKGVKLGQNRFKEPVAQAIDQTRALAQTYTEHPLVSVLPAPHSLHGASQELILAASALAKELDVPFHIHLAEQQSDLAYAQSQFGLTPLETLAAWGVLSERTVIVHGIWLSEKEKALMADVGAKLAYNPQTNMALGDGIADIPSLLAQGVCIALGSDANIHSDLFSEARAVEYLQRTRRLAMGQIAEIRQLWRMLNLAGGEVLGLQTGWLAPGYQADFLVLDPCHASLLPARFSEPLEIAFLNQMIFSMTPQTAIESVWVAGEKVVEAGQLLKVSQAEILQRVQAAFA